MEEKEVRLKNEIDLFKAKDKKSGQHWDKNLMVINKNQKQCTKQKKSLEFLLKLIRNIVPFNQSQINENNCYMKAEKITISNFSTSEIEKKLTQSLEYIGNKPNPSSPRDKI